LVSLSGGKFNLGVKCFLICRLSVHSSLSRAGGQNGIILWITTISISIELPQKQRCLSVRTHLLRPAHYLFLIMSFELG
jgi:hypothetical protein